MLTQIKNEFFRHFGHGDVSIFFSPGRVNLIGEHTDYNAGFVFPCALGFGIYLAIRKIDNKKIKMISENRATATVLTPDQYTQKQGKEWINYPLGVLNQFFKKGITLSHGFEMYFSGDIPIGAGLSSSAAIEVVTAFAVNDILEAGLKRIELAKLSQKAENEFVGVNCGIMDHFASCMGRKNQGIFLNCNTLAYEYVPIELAGIKLVIGNTNNPHKLDLVKYNERVLECKKASEAISRFLSSVLLQITGRERVLYQIFI